MSKFEEYIGRALEILKSKDGAFFTVEGSRVDDNDLLGRIMAILEDKHAELNVPLEKLDEFAIALLPRVRAFFQSEEGKREFAEWKKAQELKKNLKCQEEKSE